MGNKKRVYGIEELEPPTDQIKVKWLRKKLK